MPTSFSPASARPWKYTAGTAGSKPRRATKSLSQSTWIRVWEVVGREALKQVLGTAEAQARNGAAGALEEDARLTALFLWTLQSTGETVDGGVVNETDEDDEAPQTRILGFSLPFDVARRFAQPLGIHMEEWEPRIIQIEKGVVKLKPVTERAKDLFRGGRGECCSRPNREQRDHSLTDEPVPR